MKCNTDNCKNEDWKDNFDGNLCVPCSNYYKKILGVIQVNKPSTAQLNHIATCKWYLKQSEIYKIEEQFK